ncbi:MAG: restriction endonuclease [Candidatus Izemoplasmatales bacterium]|nr:restriction endonuclease [Candidatus Izemoplasmatales bacterium]
MAKQNGIQKWMKKKKIKEQDLIYLAVFVVVIIYLFITSIAKGEVWAIILLVVMILLFGGGLWLWLHRRKKNLFFKKDVSFRKIDKMNGPEFEQFLGELFARDGYKSEVTKTSGDFGADLVLNKDEKRIVVQAKRYHSAVGLSAVQEVVTSMRMYKADEGWVVTNNERFTNAARTLAKKNDVRLIARDELKKIIQRLSIEEK